MHMKREPRRQDGLHISITAATVQHHSPVISQGIPCPKSTLSVDPCGPIAPAREEQRAVSEWGRSQVPSALLPKRLAEPTLWQRQWPWTGSQGLPACPWWLCG